MAALVRSRICNKSATVGFAKIWLPDASRRMYDKYVRQKAVCSLIIHSKTVVLKCLLASEVDVFVVATNLAVCICTLCLNKL